MHLPTSMKTNILTGLRKFFGKKEKKYKSTWDNSEIGIFHWDENTNTILKKDKDGKYKVTEKF